jgi:EAL domain-containing protein (putative c-di-GMP-specific phosphodiesterase class I)
MYAAKQSAAGVLAYRPELDVHTRSRLSLVAELRTAVANGQLELHYQPKVALGTGEVEGAEALVRWRHPVHGLLAPIEFIPEAERTGVIGAVSDWVVEEALRTCRSWTSQHPRAPLTVAINLSTHSLEDRTLPGRIGAALARHGVAPELVELEITETTLLSDPVGAREVLDELAAMGVILAIDDFGTGYSSLAYLRDLPVRKLKIDRSFLVEMEGAGGDDALVRSVIDLARNLGLRTVAEGVEDRATARHLAELGCDSIQGFLVSHPLPRPEFDRWLAGYELAADRRHQRRVARPVAPGRG